MQPMCLRAPVAGTHGPAHLDARIDAFLAGFAEALGAMSRDELDGHREALIAAKTLKDASLHDEADRNWEQISSKTCAGRPFVTCWPGRHERCERGHPACQCRASAHVASLCMCVWVCTAMRLCPPAWIPADRLCV